MLVLLQAATAMTAVDEALVGGLPMREMRGNQASYANSREALIIRWLVEVAEQVNPVSPINYDTRRRLRESYAVMK